MSNPKGITKYYIGLGLLMILALGCLIYAFSQAGAAKTDRQTNKTVEQISSKLSTKIAQTGEIPNSLQEAGVSDLSPTVDYKKLSTTQYKVCIEYKAASGGFDAGWWSLLGGAYDNSNTDVYGGNDSSYFDSTVTYKHKKGQNCQTIKPYGVGDYYNNYDNYLKNPSIYNSNYGDLNSGSTQNIQQ